MMVSVVAVSGEMPSYRKGFSASGAGMLQRDFLGF